MSEPVRRSRRISARNSSILPQDGPDETVNDVTETGSGLPPRRASARTQQTQQPQPQTPSAPAARARPINRPGNRAGRRRVDPVESSSVRVSPTSSVILGSDDPVRRSSGFAVVLPATPRQPTRGPARRSGSNRAAPASSSHARSDQPRRRSARLSGASIISASASHRSSLASIQSDPEEEEEEEALDQSHNHNVANGNNEDDEDDEEEDGVKFSPHEKSPTPVESDQDESTLLAHTQLRLESEGQHSDDEDEEEEVEEEDGEENVGGDGTTTPTGHKSPASIHELPADSDQIPDAGQPEGLDEDVVPSEPAEPIVENEQPTPSQPHYESPMEMMQRAKALSANAVIAEEPPQSRIVIRYLTLTNFKSYAGKQVVGPFDASFSSVVGPNGSGKSNVIDSLLFVFGFRASKMRQGKLSGLIHKSGPFPDLDYCEVEVEFGEVVDRPNGAGVEMLNPRSLVISRRAFKNNSSKYYIDHRTSDYTTVTRLLKQKGVDLDHKRFLILQGEVESIAQMKPKASGEHDDGLLEYLEDIIGTSSYKSVIEEATVEADQLAETQAEKAGRVDHVARERDALEGKKAAAETYLRSENELTEKQAALWQLHRRNRGHLVHLGQKAVAELESELQAERDRHAGRINDVEAIEKAFQAATGRCTELTARRDEDKKAGRKIERELVKLHEKVKFVAGKRSKAEKRQAGAETAASEAEHKAKQAEQDIARGESGETALHEQVESEEATLAEMRSRLQGQTEGLTAELASKQHDLAPWLEQIGQKEREVKTATNELDLEREVATRAADTFTAVADRVRGWEAAVEEKEDELGRATTELEEQKAAVEKARAEVVHLAHQEDRLASTAAAARQKAQEAQSAVDGARDGNKVLAGLNRLQERGQISGFYGRLGSLGGIESRYDVAITTACPGLDNLVVETAETGQACVDYLRKSGLGRANFILLDKLPDRDLGPIETPGRSRRLYDLVHPREEKFRPAFYSVLQNTLVTGDLATAQKIAFGRQRWRVVTVDGQLIDRSGTMTGGGTRVARGGMGERSETSRTELANRLSKAKSAQDEAESKLAEISRERQEREQAERTATGRIDELDAAIRRLRVEIGALKRQVEDGQAAIAEAKKQRRKDQSSHDRLERLEAQVAQLSDELTALRDDSKDAQAAVDLLQDRIMQVGGVELRAQRAKVDGLRDRIKLVQEAIARAKSDRIRAGRTAEHERAAAVDAANEAGGTESEAAGLDSQVADLTSRAEEQQRSIDQLSDRLEDEQEKVGSLKKELDEKTAEVDVARKVEMDLTNRLDEKRKGVSEAERAVVYFDKKLSNLRLHRLDGEAEVGPVQRRHKAGRDGRKKGKDGSGGNDTEDEEEGDEEKEEEDVEMADVADGDGDDGDDGDGDDGDDNDDDDNNDNNDDDGVKPYPVFSPDELDSFKPDELERDIASLTESLSAETVDLSALEEYRRRNAEHAARSADLAAVTAERDAAANRVADLRRLRLEGFMAGFAIISARLKEMYQMITMGGNAELELVDSLDPFAEGILFSVMPPKKSWKNIGNLSGGEKTLSSLALVFALHQYKPTPVYVMDEIDAALDFRNVSIVAAYIKERTRNAQFIVISLRNNMFELATRLIGVYKINHMTRSVTVENKDYLKLGAGQRPPGVKPEGAIAKPEIAAAKPEAAGEKGESDKTD